MEISIVKISVFSKIKRTRLNKVDLSFNKVQIKILDNSTNQGLAGWKYFLSRLYHSTEGVVHLLKDKRRALMIGQDFNINAALLD